MDFGQLVLALLLAIWLAHVTKSKVALAARWGLAALSLFAIFANLPTLASVVNSGRPRPSAWVQALPSQPLSDLIHRFSPMGLTGST